MGAYVAAILMLTASVMSMIARRYLFPLPRRAPIFSPQPTGPAILIVWLLFAVGFVICAAGVAFAAGSILGRLAGQVVTSADNPAVALSFAAALLALLFAALTRRALLDHD
jgi:predicted ABC-type sugar transport system permease subunit